MTSKHRFASGADGKTTIHLQSQVKFQHSLSS